MYSKEHVIKKHIMPEQLAKELVQIMKQYNCSEIQIEKNGKKASAVNLMMIMTLCICPGDNITILADGQYGKEAVNAVCEFLDNYEI